MCDPFQSVILGFHALCHNDAEVSKAFRNSNELSHALVLLLKSGLSYAHRQFKEKYMGQILLDGDPRIAIDLRRNGRSKRLSLRVSQVDGRVTMTLPKWSHQSQAHDFAREKEGWIRAQLAERAGETTVQIGRNILFEGVLVPVVAGSGRAVGFLDGQLSVPGDSARVPVRTETYLKIIARQRLGLACDRYAQLVGRPYKRISLRDTRSRWGSCTADGNLMFSWRLVMAPPLVLDYVAAHEVAHLAEMNHSPAYWAVVAKICPGYQEWRSWLRRNGADLHAYRFRN